MKKIALAILSLLLFATGSDAQVSNGDFSAGLGGWLPTQTDEVTTSPDLGGGNPGTAALIFGNGGFFTEPEGSGSISQTFDCGDAGSQSTCVISFQWRKVFSGGVSVRLDAIVNGSVEYTSTPGGGSSGWNDVSFSVPCGTQNLRLQATFVDGGFATEWRLWFDNVTAECDAAVPSEELNWGTLKATYK